MANSEAYWYRFLVDAKLYEMEKKLGKNPTREEIIGYVTKFWNIPLSDKARMSQRQGGDTKVFGGGV